MLSQLTQLKTIGGAERINFSIQFTSDNKARVILTSQVNATATGELADLLRSPIVMTGSLSDIDMMLTNELFNLAEQASKMDKAATVNPTVTPTATNNVADTQSLEWQEVSFEDDEESL